MRKMKIVEGFYDVKKVGKVKRDNIKSAKAKNMVGVEVMVEDAYSFYMKNSWFRKQRQFKTRPLPGEQMVVVYFDGVEQAGGVEKKISEKIAGRIEKKENVVLKELRSMFASVMPKKSEQRKGLSFSPREMFEVELESFRVQFNNGSVPLNVGSQGLALAA